LRSDANVVVDTSHVSAAQAIGDRDQLARAVRNLCDNAARHARNLITLTAGEHDGMVEFSVSDDLAARFVVSLPRSVDEP
jgi:signal transduction histidine kinase